jgi:hypothetical protein
MRRYLEERYVPRPEEVIFGSRAHQIVREAMEGAVDHIVLSSHRIDRQNPSAGWVTVNYKVGILSPCAVLLVKETYLPEVGEVIADAVT